MIEPLKELEAPKAEYPPCDIRYITIGLWRRNDGTCHWMVDDHKNLERAEREVKESYLPGTGRIFEIPAKG